MRYNRNMDFVSLMKTLDEECALSKDAPIVVGVSGGPDSLCLLHILHRLNYSLLAVHVNHQLRPEADEEEEFVKRFALSMQVPCICMHVDVRSYSEKTKLSVEESARHLRYECLFTQASDYHAQAIAVAHQADDQVETVMMHILRGSGLGGIKGMSFRSFLPTYSRSIPVVRPLLGLWRNEIEHYCDENDLHPCTDITNSDPRYFRNRIRLELMPELVTYNSRAKEHLWQLSHLVQEDDSLLENETIKVLQNLVINDGEGFYTFFIQDFLIQPLAIQRRVLRDFMGRIRSDSRDIGFEPIENAIRFLKDEKALGDWQLLDDLWITRVDESKGMIYTGGADFSILWPILERDVLPCALKGTTKINKHWELQTDVVDKGSTFSTNQSDNETCFDLSELKEELYLRVIKTGERIHPFGGSLITQKTSDLFINRKIHRKARSRWPILCCGEEALWVLGVKRTQYAPVTAQTERVLVIRLVKLD